jgi:hypothetical protein
MSRELMHNATKIIAEMQSTTKEIAYLLHREEQRDEKTNNSPIGCTPRAYGRTQDAEIRARKLEGSDQANVEEVRTPW